MKTPVINTLVIGLALGTLAFLAPQRAEAQHLDFSGGFMGTDNMSLNGGDSGASILPNGKLQLSDGKLWRRGSAFSKSRVAVDVFYAKFRFQFTRGVEHTWGPMADGMTITFHNSPDGSSAIGPAGGGLAYGPDFKRKNAYPHELGIPKSVAVKFDTFNNDGEIADYSVFGDNQFGDGLGFRFPSWWKWHHSNSSGLYANGVAPTHYPELGHPAYDLTPDKIDFHSGRVFEAELHYDGTTLKVKTSDTETKASSSQSYTVDIPAIVGDTTAYVGFTASTGVFTAFQDVLNLAVNKVSYDNLRDLVRRFVNKIGHETGIINSLIQKLDAAEAAEVRGNEEAKDNILNAFINELQALNANVISPEDRELLIRLAGALM